MRIIYKTKENQVAIVQASSEWVGTIEELAKEVVPTGVKYKIIDVSDLPKNRDFRNAWEFDFSKDSDGVGA